MATKYDFNFQDSTKRLYLSGIYPKDIDPSIVRLDLPYKNGIIATLDDIVAALEGFIPDTENGTYVTTNGDQTITGNKLFTSRLEVTKAPTTNLGVTNKDYVDNLIRESIVEIEDKIDKLNNVVNESLDEMTNNLDTMDKDLTNLKNDLNNLTERLNTLIGNLGDLDIASESDRANLVAAINHVINTMKDLVVSGGGADMFYTNPEPVPETIGGVKAGTTFDMVPIKDVITMILYPYLKPIITSLSANPFEFIVGQSTGETLKVSWTTDNQDNIAENGISFTLNSNPLDGKNYNLSGSYTFNITSIKLDKQGSIPLTMIIKDVNDNTITKSIDLTWYNEIYCGSSVLENIDEANAKTFTKIRTNSLSGPYSFTGGGYKYILYPKSWGVLDPEKFINPDNNFMIAIIQQNDIDITNDYGIKQTYCVYRTMYVLNGGINIRVEK